MTPDQRSEALLLADELSLTPLADLATVADKSAALLRALASEPHGEPVATLHDDGRFTWKRDEFRRTFDRQRAGWRMDVYAHPQQRKPLTTEQLKSYWNATKWNEPLLVRVMEYGRNVERACGI